MPNLNSLMVWAATYFIHSTLLLGGVWLWFRRIEPASHAFREAVWKLAAVGGMVTASLQLGLDIQSPVNTALGTVWNKAFVGDVVTQAFANDVSRMAEKAAVRQQHPADQAPADIDGPAESETLPQFVILDPAQGDMEVDPERSTASMTVSSPLVEETARSVAQDDSATPAPASLGLDPRWRGWLTAMLAAFCGAVVALSGWGFVRLLTEQWEFRRRLATCRVVSQGTAHVMLQELLQAAGVRRPVRLMLDEQDLEPGACGWFNWQIVLPARAVEDLSKPELRGLLAHELAHLVRGDQWWLLLGRLLAVCFGWQPLNRIALREWQRASEYLCDAWAIERSVPRLSLARCLTTVAEWRLVGLATVAGLGSGNPSNLSQRVERLVDDKVALSDPWQRYSRRHLLAAASCLIAVGMVGLAPAATLSDTVRNTSQKMAAGPSSQTDPTAASAVQPARESAGEPIPDGGVEFVATDLEDSASVVVVTVETIQVLRRQVSTDMRELLQELDALQHDFSRVAPTGWNPSWQLHFQRLRERSENIQRLQSTLLVPL